MKLRIPNIFLGWTKEMKDDILVPSYLADLHHAIYEAPFDQIPEADSWRHLRQVLNDSTCPSMTMELPDGSIIRKNMYGPDTLIRPPKQSTISYDVKFYDEDENGNRFLVDTQGKRVKEDV